MESNALSPFSDLDERNCLKFSPVSTTRVCGSDMPVTTVTETPCTSISFAQSMNSHSPCLPVSKGYIKKTAQTRFVNSSPRSYRLMPASVESSDMTSFVEKSSHSYGTPMKFMLEVAEFWEISKRSELECNFTLAKSKVNFSSDRYIEEAMTRSPICHSTVIPTKIVKREKYHAQNADFASSYAGIRVGMGRKLMATVKSFFSMQELKDRFPLGIAGIINHEFGNEASDLMLLKFVEGAQNSSNQSNGDSSDDTDGNCASNCRLTPLVKRLSVSGLNESDLGDKVNKLSPQMPNTELSPSSKMHTSVKRPNSTPFMDCDEEPLQKRAFCNDSFMDKQMQPG